MKWMAVLVAVLLSALLWSIYLQDPGSRERSIAEKPLWSTSPGESATSESASLADSSPPVADAAHKDIAAGNSPFEPESSDSLLSLVDLEVKAHELLNVATDLARSSDSIEGWTDSQPHARSIYLAFEALNDLPLREFLDLISGEETTDADTYLGQLARQEDTAASVGDLGHRVDELALRIALEERPHLVERMGLLRARHSVLTRAGNAFPGMVEGGGLLELTRQLDREEWNQAWIDTLRELEAQFPSLVLVRVRAELAASRK